MNCKILTLSLAAASLLGLTAFPDVARADWVTVYKDWQQRVDVETSQSNGYGNVPYLVRIVNAYPTGGVAAIVVKGTMMCGSRMYQPYGAAALDANGRVISATKADGRWQVAFIGTLDDRIHNSLCQSPFDPFDEP
jgi:hypothetical protein